MELLESRRMIGVGLVVFSLSVMFTFCRNPELRQNLQLEILKIISRNEELLGVASATIFDDETMYLWKANISHWLNGEGMQKPPHTMGALLHVGKTGGSTLSWQLRNGCHSFVPTPCKTISPSQGYQESHISKLTTYYHTPNFAKLHKRYYKFVVVTTRDPMARTLSAFTYMHPRNKIARNATSSEMLTRFFEPCFPSMDSFVDALGVTENHCCENEENYRSTEKPNDITDCRTLARLAWQHQLESLSHFYFDLQNVARRINGWNTEQGDVAVLVVRQEALWEDWISANAWLGQDRLTVETFPHMKLRAVNGTNPPVSREISEENRATLCLSLRSEYEAYLAFMEAAVNLNSSDKLQSLELARKRCPELNLSFDRSHE